MSLKIKQVAEANFGLSKLVELDGREAKDGGQFLPYATKLKISTLFRKLKGDNDQFVKERQELVQKYGKPVYAPKKEEEEGEAQVIGYQVTGDCPDKAEFDKLFDALVNEEADLEAIKPLPADSLGENKLDTRFIMQLQDLGLLAIPQDDAS